MPAHGGRARPPHRRKRADRRPDGQGRSAGQPGGLPRPSATERSSMRGNSPVRLRLVTRQNECLLCADARKLPVTLRDRPPLAVHLGRQASNGCRMSTQAQPSPRAVAPGPGPRMTGRRRQVSRRRDGHMNPVPPPSVPLQSVVLVPVPEAELAAGPHRCRLDRAATLGRSCTRDRCFPFCRAVRDHRCHDHSSCGRRGVSDRF